MSDDNTLTREYIDHWTQLAAPLVAATGLELHAFDPGLILGDGRQSVELPTWFVEKVNQHLPNPFALTTPGPSAGLPPVRDAD